MMNDGCLRDITLARLQPAACRHFSKQFALRQQVVSLCLKMKTTTTYRDLVADPERVGLLNTEGVFIVHWIER